MSSASTDDSQKIDGTLVSNSIREELKKQVSELKSKYGTVPRLDVILVGERKDSQVYVGAKTKACEQLGLSHKQHNLPADTTQVI